MAETVLTRDYSPSETVADATQWMGSFPYSVVPFVLITRTADGLAADGAQVTGLTLRGGAPHDGHGMAPGLGFFVDRVRDVAVEGNYIENLNDGAYSALATVRFEGNAHDSGVGPFGGTFGVAAFAGSERFPADVVVRRNRFRNHSHASVLISAAGASDSIWAYTLGEELRDDPEVGRLLPSSIETEIADTISARIVENELAGMHAPAEPGRLADEVGAQVARGYTQSGVWLYTTPRRFHPDQATSSIRATVAANEIGGTYSSPIYVWPGPRPGFSPLASRIDLTLADNRLDPTPLAEADGDVRLSFLRGGVLENSTLRVTADREDAIAITHPARHCENGLVASTEIGDCRVLNNRLFVNGELQPQNCPVLHGASPSCLPEEGAVPQARRLLRIVPR